MEKIILSQISIEDLQSAISEAIASEFAKLKNTKPSNDVDELFITRQETAKILGISLPTLHDWTKKNVLKCYRIQTRVRYKKIEVIETFKAINYKS